MNTAHRPARGCRRALASLAALLAASLGYAQDTTTTGVPNVVRSEPVGSLLSHPRDTNNGSHVLGRTTTVNYLRGWLIVGPFLGEDKPMKIFDVDDPSAPREVSPSLFGQTGASWHLNTTGWNAHGSAQTEDTFVYPSIRVASFGGAISRGPGNRELPIAYNRSSMAGPWWATFDWYGTQTRTFQFGKVYDTNPTATLFHEAVVHGTIEHTAQYGGGDWHPIFFGDLLIYVRSDDNSSPVITGRDGIVVYRITYENFDHTDRSQRRMRADLVGTPLSTGFSGYWPNLYSDGNRLYVVGSSSGRVMAADITDAADPRVDTPTISLVADYSTPLNNATYPVYKDNFAFIHNKKFDMALLLARNANPVTLTLNENTLTAHGTGRETHALGVDTTQMALPLGNLWLTGGYDGHTGKSGGMGIWVHDTARDLTKPTVAFHVPQRDRANYPLHAPLSFLIHETPRRGAVRPGTDFTVRPVVNGVLGAHVSGFGLQDMSGIYTYTPNSPLSANTTYQVDFLSDDRGTTNLEDDIGFQDAAGNLMNAYSFRFSTGSLTPPTPPTISGVSADNHQPAAGATITVTATAEGTGHEFRFYKNGAWTTWSPSNQTTVSYSAAGRYRVQVQVRNAAGGVASSYVNILVPPGGALALAPTHSNTMAIGQDAAGRRLWVVNPDSDTVSVLDASTGARIANGEYRVGKNPRSIARDRHGRYWVTVMGEDKIVVLNQNGTVFETIGGGDSEVPYGAAPFAVCSNHDGSVMFVSYYGLGRLARFNVSATSTDAIPVPTLSPSTKPVPTARAIAVRSEGTATRVFVTRFISPDHKAEVHEFNGTHANLDRTRVIDIEYNGASDAGDNGAGVMNYLAGIAITPDGKYALVTGKKDNIGRGPLYTDPSPPAGFPVGVGDLTPINTVRAALAVINLSTNLEIAAARRDFDNSDSPTAVTFSSRGDTAFIALQGNNRVFGIDTIDVTTGGGSALESVGSATGLAPQGVLYDANAKRLFVQNFMDRSVTVLNAEAFHDRNETAFTAQATTPTVATELLSQAVLKGKQLFYNAADSRMSEDSYISCATCHVDGGHDGRVWDFTDRGEGLRRTTDLRGRGGLAHGNVHWTANFDEIQDFEHDIRDHFNGTGFMPLSKSQFDAAHQDPTSAKSHLSGPGYDDLNNLAAYVSSLGTASVPRSPHRNTDGTLTSSPSGKNAVAGERLFRGLDAPYLNCATCHAGSRHTDSAVAPITTYLLDNVGTVINGSSVTANNLSGSRRNGAFSGIDVPSLIGLHASRVYLHHGLAESLEDAFTFSRGTVIQAEAATPLNTITPTALPELRTNGIQVITVRRIALGGGGENRGALGAKFYSLTDAGHALSFTGITGGGSGEHFLRIRYRSRWSNTSLKVAVNSEAETPTNTMPSTGDRWVWFTHPITLPSGSNNTIRLARNTSNVGIDAIMVVTPADLSAAVAHRQIFGTGMDDTKRGDLLAYLRQIDGRDAFGDVTDPDLILHYTFDEGAGTTLNDFSVSGNDHTTTLATTQWLTDGKFGGSMGTTNGTSAFASFNPANQSDLTFRPRADAYTVSAWVKTNTTSTYRTVFSKGRASSRQVFVQAETPASELQGVTGNTASAVITTPALNNNTWHLVTLVNFNDNGTWKSRIYLNGGKNFQEFASGTVTTTDAFRIGAASDGWNSWHGQIDDFRVYKRALTPAEIDQLYAGQEPIAP